MMVDVKSTILRSGDFLAAGEIAKLAEYSEKNPSAQPNKWKKAGAIFAIQYKGTDYFPLCALNPDENYRPYKAVVESSASLQDQYQMGACVLVRRLERLPGWPPSQDLLVSHPDRVLAAARHESEAVQHG